MYTVRIENECSCFKKSEFENNLVFEDKADAIMKAKVLECRMSQEFCQTHYFEAEDLGDEIVIRTIENPAEEEEDWD
ncbi:MAG TPA: hypothetical protein ENK82_00755 [Campylobacterales bacterium]|nr:hypothetical protein [Campylobacterales bacterium]HHS91853.1 hypothetical protein [Campylobacterales bacterium]